MILTREWFHEQAEQGNPSDSGEWCAVPLVQLIEQGYLYLEVHYPDDEDGKSGPNAVQLSREDGEP